MREGRYSRSLRVQKLHFFVGLAISLVFTLLIAFNGFNFWTWQASVMDRLLSFAGVSHRLFISGGLTEGNIFPPLLESYVSTDPTFEIPVHYRPIPSTTVIVLLILLASSILIVNIFRIIPPPVTAVWSIISILAILTLLWQTTVSPIPAYTLHWVTIDWSCSGVINLCLITLIYVPFLFTIKGPLWVKVFWLFTAIGFSIFWNLLRMSLVTATLYYLGGLVFLLFHYVLGAFIDFVYIVAFYSLALAHLSKCEASEAMKLDV
jgi:exosortase/archaeosortase family protein